MGSRSEVIASADKLQVLCLHGYRQSGDSFKSKLGSFRKLLNKYVNFTFVTAPHTVPKTADANEKSDDSQPNDEYSWWFNHDNGTFKGTNKNGPAFGFEKSLHFLESVWKEQGPFDGILGFSQGACLAGLLCSLSERGMTSIKPKFAIICAGFRSGSLVHLNYYEESISIPSLHIFGLSDDIIPSEMSELLVSSFANSQILTHPGGHYFAATTREKKTYIEFFQDLLQSNLEEKEIANADNTNSFDVSDNSP